MLPDPMVSFIRKHHVLTLAVSANSDIWVAHCFYAYDAVLNRFIFTSDEHTRHIEMIAVNNKVSAGISLETKVVGNIRGIQMSGRIEKPEADDYEKAKKTYLKRFPYAILVTTSFWALYPQYAKMTDNRLGFGKKLNWDENQ
jgi:uncharacterized protein YhbP (UPF0306 family)